MTHLSCHILLIAGMCVYGGYLGVEDGAYKPLRVSSKIFKKAKFVDHYFRLSSSLFYLSLMFPLQQNFATD